MRGRSLGAAWELDEFNLPRRGGSSCEKDATIRAAFEFSNLLRDA